jgi:hypothetical protein
MSENNRQIASYNSCRNNGIACASSLRFLHASVCRQDVGPSCLLLAISAAPRAVAYSNNVFHSDSVELEWL